MERTSLTPTTLDVISDEHEALTKLYERILNALQAGPGNISLAATLVDELRNKLVAHFEHEEEGGYYSHVVDAAPWRASSVEELKQQHVALLKIIRRVAEGIRMANESPLWGAAVRNDFSEFLRRCVEHESHENRLIQEVYVLDVAAAD
jgi:hypothetical protein